MDALIEMMEEALKNDKLFEMGAKTVKKAVEALEKEGFTRSEAIKIAAASQGKR